MQSFAVISALPTSGGASTRAARVAGGCPGQGDVDEALVLERHLGALDLPVRLRARQALAEMAPVGRYERAGLFVRAGRGDVGAWRDQLLAQREDARVAGRRAGLDHDQRVARFRPHRFRELALIGLAELADDVARHDEIGLRDLGEVGAGVARQIAAIGAAASCRAPVRAPARLSVALASSRVKSCSDGKASAAAQLAVPGPAPTSSRRFRREVRRDLDQRIQAGGHGRIGRRHPRQRVGERIGLRLDGAGAAACAIGRSRSSASAVRRRCARSPAACRRGRLSVRRGGSGEIIFSSSCPAQAGHPVLRDGAVNREAAAYWIIRLRG